MKILFVCLGNICRSPAAEGILRKLGDDKMIIDSAGTSSFHEGEPADARMIKHAKRRGYDLNSISRGFVSNDFDHFDFIFVMDESNYKNITKLTNDKKYLEKVILFTDYHENNKINKVPDPYYGGDQGFENVLDILENCCKNFLLKLNQ